MDPLDRLTRIDLNLLVSLYVLLEEQNVTRAAERLFITQPAASRTLNRLRELFDDPLLARQGMEMVMTPRAQALRARLPAVLESVGGLVAPQAFDPATHEQHFRLAIPEIFAQALAADLMHTLAEQAPRISLSFRDPDEVALQGLLSGDIDFLVRQRRHSPAPPALLVEPLEGGGAMLVARAGHPLARKRRLSLDQVLAYPWVDCYPADSVMTASPVDLLLGERGLQRHILLHTTHLLSALEAITGNDCLLLLAAVQARHGLLDKHCARLSLPTELADAGFQLELAQNRRSLASEPHQWLRGLVVNLLARNTAR